MRTVIFRLLTAGQTRCGLHVLWCFTTTAPRHYPTFVLHDFDGHTLSVRVHSCLRCTINYRRQGVASGSGSGQCSLVLLIVPVLTILQRSTSTCNFFNYTHSVLVLMLWVLPINIPVLVVWVHNLAVHWLTPFSSHHNVLSIMPFVLLVESLTGGTMIPRVQSKYVNAFNQADPCWAC